MENFLFIRQNFIKNTKNTFLLENIFLRFKFYIRKTRAAIKKKEKTVIIYHELDFFM